GEEGEELQGEDGPRRREVLDDLFARDGTVAHPVEVGQVRVDRLAAVLGQRSIGRHQPESIFSRRVERNDPQPGRARHSLRHTGEIRRAGALHDTIDVGSSHRRNGSPGSLKVTSTPTTRLPAADAPPPSRSARISRNRAMISVSVAANSSSSISPSSKRIWVARSSSRRLPSSFISLSTTVASLSRTKRIPPTRRLSRMTAIWVTPLLWRAPA